MFSAVQYRNCILAVVLGASSGPLFYHIAPDWSVPVPGFLAGTIAFVDWSARMNSFEPSVVLVLCILGTFNWRAVGAAIASRIDVSSDLFQ